MTRLPVVAAALAAAALLAPASAVAAPPANDGPGAPAAFAPFTAENGTPQAQTADVDLAEATADAGVPRCLGSGSFAKTVWLTVPASAQPQLVRLAALTRSGEPDQAPQLAAFVQPSGGTQTKEPQACDEGAELLDRSAEVELRVPAGRSVLVQVGRAAAATITGVSVSLEASPAPDLATPPGDDGRRARTLPLGRQKTVPLTGATLTDEDPAQPACPAGGTVWRKLKVTRAGTYRVLASGASLGTLTTFVGSRPRGAGARTCAVRTTSDRLRATVKLKRGSTLWLRLGTDRPDAGDARLKVSRGR